MVLATHLYTQLQSLVRAVHIALIPAITLRHTHVCSCTNMHTRGIEPRSQAWKACMMPLHYVCDYKISLLGKEGTVLLNATTRTYFVLTHVIMRGPDPTRKCENAETRDRTGDLQIFGLTLSQLSYRGLAGLWPRGSCLDAITKVYFIIHTCNIDTRDGSDTQFIKALCGDRAHDHTLTKRMLYQLS
jgi:hypothetical protein